MEALAVQPDIIQPEANQPYLWPVEDAPDELFPLPVGEAPFDLEAKRRFEQWTGILALADVKVTPIERPPAVNILERLEAARQGSAEAKSWLKINIKTATCEAVCKEDYVTRSYMERNAAGELTQFGQTNEQVHFNSLTLRPNRHPVLQAVTKAEALNRHYIESALDADRLKDYYFVAFSLVPNGVPEHELGVDGDGYFLTSLSLNIQATTELPNGKVKIETGFMAGVETDQNASFEERLEKRHDFEAVAKVHESFRQTPRDNAADLLEHGMYIPKDMMPNGVVDVMRWVAIAGDEVLGRDVERRPEDFMALWFKSKQLEASIAEVEESVLYDLLAKTELEMPKEGVAAMWESIRYHATKNSFKNALIDPKVFGATAASDIEKVRYYIQNGQEHLAESYKEDALEHSEVSGCGGGAGTRKSDNKTQEGGSGQGDDADCEYISKSCPKCGKKNVKTTDKKLKGSLRKISGSCGCSLVYTKK